MSLKWLSTSCNNKFNADLYLLITMRTGRLNFYQNVAAICTTGRQSDVAFLRWYYMIKQRWLRDERNLSVQTTLSSNKTPIILSHGHTPWNEMAVPGLRQCSWRLDVIHGCNLSMRREVKWRVGRLGRWRGFGLPSCPAGELRGPPRHTRLYSTQIRLGLSLCCIAYHDFSEANWICKGCWRGYPEHDLPIATLNHVN